jgi:DNA-binding CsgD family transcriptional regulator
MATGRPDLVGASTEGHLQERGHELDALGVAIERARGGLGGAVIVEAAAGIGKTTLLALARAEAAHAGLRVLRATGRELERDFPFGVVRQLFEEPLHSASGIARGQLLSGAAAPAAALLGATPRGSVPPDAAFAFVHGIYWLAANLAERQPLMLAVDDLHLADVDSLRALVYLTARLEELPLLLAAATRTGEGGSVPEAELRASANVQLLRPAPLSLEATANVVRAALGGEAGDELCRACHGASGGNPFLARELALAAVAEGIAASDSAVGIAELAPATVAHATLPRIRRLGPDARAFGRAVAVLDRAELRIAAALADMDEGAAANAADALMEAGILAAEHPLRFEHPVIATVVLDEATPAFRERAHRRAAELLHAAGAPVESVASHLMRSEPRGESWAAKALRAAGCAALESGAPETAARNLRRALEEGGDTGGPALLHELGRAEAACGSPGALEHLVRAQEQASDPAARARVLETLAETRFVAGDLRAAVEALREAHDQVDAERGSQFEVQLFLGYIMLARAYAPTALDAQERICRRLAQADGDALGGPARLAARAYDGFLRGERAERVREDATAALADARLLEAGGPAAQAYYLTTWALAGADGFEEAEAALARAHDRAAESGSFLTHALACHHRLWPRWRRGAIPLALADAEVSLELAARGWRLIGPAAQWARSECLLETGDAEAAAEAVESAERLEPGLAGSCVEAWPLIARSRLALERGDPETARTAALRCGSLLGSLLAENPSIAAWRSRAALAAATLGDHGLARELWQEELDLARRCGAPRAIGIALRTGGLVEERSRGIELLRESAAVLERSPALLERARSMIELGAALRRARRPREAREPLRHGLDLAGACGARAVAAFAHDELLATGARPRRQATRGPDALTPRELQIAALAAKGLGNREIAQSLFITRKTAESHLRNIFRKLGIESRGQIAEELGRRDRA